MNIKNKITRRTKAILRAGNNYDSFLKHDALRNLVSERGDVNPLSFLPFCSSASYCETFGSFRRRRCVCGTDVWQFL